MLSGVRNKDYPVFRVFCHIKKKERHWTDENARRHGDSSTERIRLRGVSLYMHYIRVIRMPLSWSHATQDQRSSRAATQCVLVSLAGSFLEVSHGAPAWPGHWLRPRTLRKHVTTLGRHAQGLCSHSPLYPRLKRPVRRQFRKVQTRSCHQAAVSFHFLVSNCPQKGEI